MMPASIRWSILWHPPGSAETNLVLLPYFSHTYSAMWPTWVVFVEPLRPYTQSAFGPREMVTWSPLQDGSECATCTHSPRAAMPRRHDKDRNRHIYQDTNSSHWPL